MLSYVSLNSNRPQAVMATGQVLFHRFYCKKSFARFGVKVLRHYNPHDHFICDIEGRQPYGMFQYVKKYMSCIQTSEYFEL